jgi:hypothetical protein
MPLVGFEPKTPVFERAKTVHALGRAATVIGMWFYSVVHNYFRYITSEKIINSHKIARTMGQVMCFVNNVRKISG